MPIAIVASAAAENLDRGGGRVMRLLMDAAATEQRFLVLACGVPAGSAGPPLHIHPATDELFVVQEGSLLLHVDGSTHRLGAGDAAFVPRGTAHTFASPPDSPATFLTVHTPGGFEQMHRDVCHAEQQAGHALTAAEIVPIAARHDWTLAGPPLLPSGELAGESGATSSGGPG